MMVYEVNVYRTDILHLYILRKNYQYITNNENRKICMKKDEMKLS